MTAKAIGKLALAEGTYTAEYVEFEVKRALEWLTGSENKKLAAVSVGEWGGVGGGAGCRVEWDGAGWSGMGVGQGGMDGRSGVGRGVG